MKNNGTIKKHLLVFLDTIIFIVSYYVAYWGTMSLSAVPIDIRAFIHTLPALLIVKYAVFSLMGVFKDITPYFSIAQFQSIVKASLLSSLLIYSLSTFFQGISSDGVFPPHVFIFDCLVATFLLTIRRVLPLSFWGKGKVFGEKDLRRVLIVGAGEAGEIIVHAMLKSHRMPYLPVCFVDDDSYKIGKRIHGVPVAGMIADIEKITVEKDIDEILIAIPSASGKAIRRIIETAKKLKAPITTMPSMADLISGKARVEEIRKVDKNDLLRREPIRIATTPVREYLSEKIILITGAGGSIGSELARQVCHMRPRRVYLLDHSEVNLFTIEHELRKFEEHLEIVPLLANITDYDRMEEIISTCKPDVIFHTAAYKHVNLLEFFPHEAFKNNVLGTKYLAQLANQYQVKRFVYVSTDKAVDPICVMGFTKKIAELYVQSFASREDASTTFLTVRFGNVLGSAGSVVTIFEKQIQNRENLTVTHPEAVRYFMTIAEACQLIMQAGVMGRGGETFLLKMGEPVKILDLAKNLITLSGLVVDEDIKIVYTGLKPGEKMSEKLVGEMETELPTMHAEITTVTKTIDYNFYKFDQTIQDVEEEYRNFDSQQMLYHLNSLSSYYSYPIYK